MEERRYRGVLWEQVDELRKAAYRIDTRRFSDEILELFKSKLDERLSRRLAVDDAWVNNLLLEGDLVEEVDDITIRDLVLKVTVDSLDMDYGILIVSVGVAGGYELRLALSPEAAGIALVSDEHTIIGSRVLDHFGGMKVSGEIYRVEVE